MRVFHDMEFTVAPVGTLHVSTGAVVLIHNSVLFKNCFLRALYRRC